MPVETKSSKRLIIDIILVVVLVLVVAGAWFMFVSKTNKDADNRAKAAEVAKNPQTTVSTKKIQNLNIPVFLQISTDTAKLPEGTPEDFSAYMKAKLIALACTDKKFGGITIDKISDDFVRGAVVCNGGTVTYWYKQDGAWKELSAKTTPKCSDIEKTKVPIEFASTCLTSDGNEVPNTVGIYR